MGIETRDRRLSDFAAALASGDPTPGGGGGSAVAAALSAALGAMVANLTVGKPKYAAVSAGMTARVSEAQELREHLFALADADAEAFLPLSRAYALPTDTVEQRMHKDEVMERALNDASVPPIDIMKCCAEIVDMLEYVAQNGSALAISDAGAAAALCAGAMRAASLNVYINAKYMKNAVSAEKYRRDADAMLEMCVPRAERIFETVLGRLNAKRGETNG